ncbi:GSCOCG00012497001-RA-CDS, partial [Cotesia congregata]
VYSTVTPVSHRFNTGFLIPQKSTATPVLIHRCYIAVFK